MPCAAKSGMRVDVAVVNTAYQPEGPWTSKVYTTLPPLTAVQLNRGRSAHTVSTTTHADGSQTTTEQQQRNDSPPAV